MPASKLPENETIAEFERKLAEITGRTDDLANRARLMLGLTAGHYYDLRSNRRELPLYLNRSIRFALAIPTRGFLEIAQYTEREDF